MDNEKRELHPGQIYRHFKGKLYQIVAVAKHSETGEKLVIYQQLYGKYEVYARPYSMFLSEVDLDKYPNAGQRYRFEYVTMENIDSGNCRQEEKQETFEEEASELENIPLGDIKPDWENPDINPILMEFLDADTYEEKRNILINNKGKITDRLIDDMAASIDVTVDKEELDKRFASLLVCIDTRAKFEVNRLR